MTKKRDSRKTLNKTTKPLTVVSYNSDSGEVLYTEETVADAIAQVANEVRDLLISKNKAYGNSALNPRKIFSKLNAKEAILARLDDKLMRIQNKGVNDQTEDTVKDVCGYLILLMVDRKLNG